jgi:hypothetical protein
VQPALPALEELAEVLETRALLPPSTLLTRNMNFDVAVVATV